MDRNTLLQRLNSNFNPLLQMSIPCDLSPIFRTMATMRFPVNLTGWRSRYEEAVHRRTNH
jgi:hypothetical protein